MSRDVEINAMRCDKLIAIAERVEPVRDVAGFRGRRLSG